MKHFTHSLRMLVAIAIGLFGVSSWAQEEIILGAKSIPVVGNQEVQVQEEAGVTYSGLTSTFDASALAASLGVESLSSATQYIVNVTTNEAVENSSDGWRNGSGDLCLWGDITADSRGYCVKISEPDNGIIDYLGAHHNGTWGGGDQFTAKWGFVANDKAALVTVVVTFKGDVVVVEKPEAVEKVSQIQEVGSAEVTSERYLSAGFVSTSGQVDVTGLAEKLGLPKADLASYFADIVYMAAADPEMGFPTDSLAHITADGGWMLQGVENNDGIAGDPLEQVFKAPWSQVSGKASYYLQEMAYAYDEDAGTETVTFIVGNMPSMFDLESKLYTDLYVLNGDKGYRIRHHLTFIEEVTENIEGMTCVGTLEVEKEMYPATGSDYSTVPFAVLNLDEIGALMGCQGSELVLRVQAPDGGFSTFAANTTNSGWWLNKNGYPCGWSNDAESGSYFYVEPAETANFESLTVGQYPGMCAAGTSYSTVLYLTHGANYYQINFTLNVVEKPVSDWQSWTNVATRSYTIQGTQASFNWSDANLLVPNADLMELLDTTSPTFYGTATAAKTEETGSPYTDDYSCTPLPGFWMDADGLNVAWGGEGMCWGISAGQASQTDGFAVCVMNSDGPEVGTTYGGKFYLVNLENSKMMTLNITYKIVSEIAASEQVGTGSLVLPISTNEAEIAYDLTEIATAIGYADVDEMAQNNVLSGLQANGQFSEAGQPSQGLTFDAEGNVNEEGFCGIYFENGNVYTWANENTTQGWSVSTQINFQHHATKKVYTINLTLMNAEDYATGIQATMSVQPTNQMFDLQGRQVTTSRPGIYVQKGRKVIIK